MPTVKIEPNYKVTIPKEARGTFGFRVGEEVQIIPTPRPQKSLKEGTATPQEIRAIKRGRTAYARDEHIPLTSYIRGLETPAHKTRAKKSAKNQ